MPPRGYINFQDWIKAEDDKKHSMAVKYIEENVDLIDTDLQKFMDDCPTICQLEVYEMLLKAGIDMKDYTFSKANQLVGFKKLDKPVKVMWFPRYYSDKSIDWHVEHFGAYELETKLPARKEGIKIDEYIDLQKCIDKIEKKHVDDYEEWDRAKNKGLYISNYITEDEIGLSLNSEEYTLPQTTRQYVIAHGYWVKD